MTLINLGMVPRVNLIIFFKCIIMVHSITIGTGVPYHWFFSPYWFYDLL